MHTSEELPAIPGDPLIGKILNEKYRILNRIGAGGMATVYRAREKGLIERDVAIKVLSRDARLSTTTISRFLREAQSIASVQHPNVVHLMDIWRSDDGILYIVMELLHGKTLADMLAEMVAQDYRFTWEDLKPLLLQICSALKAAHKSGIIHRDIKPSNIFCCRTDGEQPHIKLLDFGISKLQTSNPASEDSIETPLTQEGMFVGTPHYAAPEIIERRNHLVDGRVDIFSLGVVMYQCLTGALPFEEHRKDPLSVLYKTARDRPVSPAGRRPEIASNIDALVMKALEVRPDDRYRTVSELIVAIRNIHERGDDPRHITPLVNHAPTGRLPPPPPRRPSIAARLRLTAILLLAVRSLRHLFNYATKLFARRTAEHDGEAAWQPCSRLDIESKGFGHIAREIESFLQASFDRFRKVGDHIIQLDYRGSKRRATLIKWEHYCLFIGPHFGGRADELSTTTFVERLVSIDPILRTIKKNVRKTVFVITNSRHIGQGIIAKIRHYRSELDVYVVPILEPAILEADKTRSHGAFLVGEFNRRHPTDVRLITDEPLNTATLDGHTELVSDGIAHLTDRTGCLLIVGGLPASGRTSVTNAVCTELQSAEVRRQPLVVIDDVLPKDIHSRALTDKITGHLSAGQNVILTMVRCHDAWIEALRSALPSGTPLKHISTRPLKGAEWISFVGSLCFRLNADLDHRTMMSLHDLSGGIVGLAIRILNNAMRTALSTSSGSSFADQVGVLRPVRLTSAEITRGATMTVAGSRFLSKLNAHFLPVEIAVLQSASLGYKSGRALLGDLSGQFSPVHIKKSILDLADLSLLKSTRSRGEELYCVSITALRYWIEGISDVCEAPSSPGTATTPADEQAPTAAHTQHHPKTEDHADRRTPESPPVDLADEMPTIAQLKTRATPMRTIQVHPGKKPTRDPSRRPSRRASLADLLKTLFNDEELRTFVSGLDGGPEILHGVPPAALITVVDKIIDALERHGHLVSNSTFFHRLFEVFPKRHRDIAPVARLWGFDPPPSEGSHGQETISKTLFAAKQSNNTIYISYAQDAWPTVKNLAAGLHRWGFQILLDPWEPAADGELRCRVDDERRRTTNGLVVVSAAFIESQQFIEFLNHIDDSSKRCGRRLIPVLAGDLVPPAFLLPENFVDIRTAGLSDDTVSALAQSLVS